MLVITLKTILVITLIKISKSKSSFGINTKVKSVKMREFKIWDIIRNTG